MIRPHHPWSVVLALLLLACDGGKDPKAADAKATDAKKTDAKGGEVKATDAKQADAKKADAEVVPASAAKHFDVSKDESGVLARSAAVLEVAKAHDDEHLRALSHHAESLPTAEALCQHEVEVGKSDIPVPACITAMEHHLVQLGPELYAEYAACIMAAKTPDEIAICDEAEREAERLLHVKPHGEGLAKEVCEQLFAQFEKLSMADAGDHAELVKGVLEEVKADIITTCQEQGTKAEADCAMKATNMAELDACASKLL